MSDWEYVQRLFLDSVDLPSGDRARFLEDRCAGNWRLHAEVESLLAADLESGASIQSAIQTEAAHLFDTQVVSGQRMGIYRIVREIGRGGMGSVYLAHRDDHEYSKEVALKIVKRGMDTAEVLERFRYERQILANLEHPYIARMFDGGSTGDGVPFFVMEYIEGRPLDVFCRESSLDSNARCNLFLRILEAVAYAHRSLVVHRDLKPANILVTAEGTPKLLDFGVAKLLSGNPGDGGTRTSVYRPFTPGYASPEQVRGLPITTSTDIYSLGAILYELLTGKPAQKILVHTPSEIARIVCDTEVLRPGVQARGLSPDLENIVLMAMRKDSERRYQSADQFAEDIRRYLQGRPVIARQDSLTYRLRKFVVRNRIQVAMATVVTAALVVGLVISLAQTRRAQVAMRSAESQRLIAVHQTSLAETASIAESTQRAVADQQRAVADQQRDEAQRQKALANQRVNDILKLANNTLFDVHDAIAPLPGSTSARRMLVRTTLEYLQNLERKVGLDDDMREALCAAYYKVAMIQGDSEGASLQDFHGAEINLLKAQELILPAYNHKPGDARMMLRLIEVRSGLADRMYRSGRQKQAIQMYSELLPVTHRLSLTRPCDLVCETQEPVLEDKLAFELLGVDPSLALEHANQGIAIERVLIARHPDEASLQQGLGSLMAAGAGAYKALGSLDKAGEYYVESVRAREELLHKDPNNSAIRRNLLIAYSNYAALLGIPWSPNLNRPEEARTYALKSVALARQMVAADANNTTARHDLGMSLSRLGMIDPPPDGTAESLANLQEGRGLIEPIAGANTRSSETATQVALILQYEGHRQDALGKTADAIASYRRSIAIVEPLLDLHNISVTVEYLGGEQSLALLYAAAASDADHSMALALARHALTIAKRYNDDGSSVAAKTSTLATSWSVLAVVQSKTGMRDEGRQSAQNAMQLWDSIKVSGYLSAHRQAIADTQNILNLPNGS